MIDTGAGGDPGQPSHVVQNVSALAGFAYGAINADVHVHGDGSPVYSLEEYSVPCGPPQGAWIEQPSQLLDARHALVPFTARASERAELAQWRDSGAADLAVRWLHAPGGQGKTRLATQFAADAAEASWKTITARHGGDILPASQSSHDIRPDSGRGLIVLVDYADRWPLRQLNWLFANSVFTQSVPIRVLLLARTSYAWPALAATLNDRAVTSEQLLTPLPPAAGDRERMFAAAYTAFAQLYGRHEAAPTAPSDGLRHADFGLTLTLHMAALAAVDAVSHGQTPPDRPDRVSAYLLRRERLHWTRRYESRPEGLEVQTKPATMAKVVFTAALTGPTTHENGRRVLQALDIPGPSHDLLDDHAACYPPTEHGTVLEPLHPDRLAEDFLALLLPGHDFNDHTPDPWAMSAVAALLDTTGTPSPTDIARAVTFLAAAAARWPHVGPHCLYPLLRARPELAIDAGTAALVTLAGIEDIDMTVLEAIDEALQSRLGDRRQVDLDVGIAAIAQRLTDSRLPQVIPNERGPLYAELGRRLSLAGRWEQALTAARQAVEAYRQIPALTAENAQFELMLGSFESALSQPGVNKPPGERKRAQAAITEIARRLLEQPLPSSPLLNAVNREFTELASRLTKRNRATLVEARAVLSLLRQQRRLVAAIRDTDLAHALTNLSGIATMLGKQEEAIAAATEAVDILQGLAARDPAEIEPFLASAYHNLSGVFLELRDGQQAATTAQAAVTIRRRLTETDPNQPEAGLARSLVNFSAAQMMLDRPQGTREAAMEATTILGRLASQDPTAYLPEFTEAVANLANAGLDPGATKTLLDYAIQNFRSLVRANPTEFEPGLAKVLAHVSRVEALLERHQHALAASQEAVDILQRIATTNPIRYEPDLAFALRIYADVRVKAEREIPEALAAAQRSAEIYQRLPMTAATSIKQNALEHLADLLEILDSPHPVEQGDDPGDQRGEDERGEAG